MSTAITAVLPFHCERMDDLRLKQPHSMTATEQSLLCLTTSPTTIHCVLWMGPHHWISYLGIDLLKSRIPTLVSNVQCSVVCSTSSIVLSSFGCNHSSHSPVNRAPEFISHCCALAWKTVRTTQLKYRNSCTRCTNELALWVGQSGERVLHCSSFLVHIF